MLSRPTAEAQGLESRQEVKIDNRSIRTVLPVETTEFPIRLMDWRRIHRKVRQIPQSSALYSNLASAAIGLGAGAVFALISQYQGTENIEAWVKPTTWAIFITSIILAIVFFKVSSERDRDIKSTCDEVKRDMQDIQECYFPGERIE
jgi:hypothetical protein